MKTWIVLITFFTSSFALAVSKPTYQIDFQLMEKGKVLTSGLIIVEEGKTGEIQSGGETEASLFSAQVTSSLERKLAMDFTFKNIKDGKLIDIAKKALAMNSGTPSVNSVKDSTGTEFQLQVTVTEK